ncbi:MAG: UV DNA damage repair endonuclease UvsE [Candidatus Hodarchaeota archaeon]
MKIGYPCINLALKCKSSRTFRLKNYSKERLIQTITNNLNCLEETLKFNVNNRILFFRITSDLIPFGSHPVMDFNWQDYFKKNFQTIGNFIKNHAIRITMHPGQYTVLNSIKDRVFKNSVNELIYHTDILDLLRLDKTAKIITHVGGVYDDKQESINRFINRYHSLDKRIKQYYAIENDDKSFTIDDCLSISEQTRIPVIFDVYHHECNPIQEKLQDILKKVIKTWEPEDGLPILHYSSKHLIKGKCRHADSININHFKKFIESTRNDDFDIMIEIKNKEVSALKAINAILNDERLNLDN